MRHFPSSPYLLMIPCYVSSQFEYIPLTITGYSAVLSLLQNSLLDIPLLRLCCITASWIFHCSDFAA
jgi:hypothetical protein